MRPSTPALSQSLLNFIKVSGKTLSERSDPFSQWIGARRDLGVWPYSRVLLAPALHHTIIADEFGLNPSQGINFASQDYLGLANRVELKQAAHTAIDQFGVHSAGSPALCGRTSILLELEFKIANQLGYESCLIYATGWAAGFGVVTGLVREADTIIVDALCHNCIQEGAKHVTSNLRKFNHNDTNHLEQLLREERANNTEGAIFIAVESLYSMDSDSPDLNAVIHLAQRYEAIVILDVAHDFGAMGEHGQGLIDTINVEGWRDFVVVMGSFSKTFAANGGYVVCSIGIRQYLRSYSTSQLFSNAISPLQTAIINKSFEIAFSEEGELLRKKLAANILKLRNTMQSRSFNVAGTASPIVPVFVGAETDVEAAARLTSKYLLKNNLHANLVEFPSVPRGKARFRFQVMATHEEAQIEQAADIMAESRLSAIAELKVLTNRKVASNSLIVSA